MKVTIQTTPFDVDFEYTQLAQQGNPGAIAMFVGQVRDVSADTTSGFLHLEHYPGMAEKQITQIINDANHRWNIIDVTVIHRVGTLHAHDPIVFVGVTSTHRSESFAACEFIMDHLKSTVPFWKKEGTAEASQWLTPRQQDHADIDKWQKKS